MGLKDWLFGKDRGSGDAKKDKQQQAIATLKKQVNTLEVQGKKMQRQADEQRELAKTMMKNGNKAGAKQALTRSKLYLQKLNRTQNMMLNLQSQIDTIQDATSTVEVVGAMKVGTQVVGDVMADVDAMDVEATMVEMEDQRDRLEMMNEALADTTSIEMGLDGDFADSIDEELAALELEMQGDLPEAGTKVSTPSESSTEKEKTEGPSELEKELEALKNELDSD